MTPKIYIYRRSDLNGKIYIVSTYESVAALVKSIDNFSNFSSNFEDRCSLPLLSCDREAPSKLFSLEKSTHYCYVCYDEFDKHYSKSQLVGISRSLNTYKETNYKSWAKRGGKWRGLRYIRTTQEIKWVHAWDNEEFAPRIRAKRNEHNLPTLWDDFWRYSNKNWKKQSKRQRQWKPKKVV